MPFKNFTAGQVLTESDLDDFLMRQTVMVFASSAARNTALSGVLVEGMMVYLEDVNALQYYNGSVWRNLISQWTSFTPTWTGVTVGSGTQNGSYRYNGRALDVRVNFTLGSGSVVAAATPVQFALPNSETSASTGTRTLGSVWYTDNTGTDFVGTCQVNTASSACFLYTSAIVSPTETSPFTWATGDNISVSINGIPLAS